MESCHSQYILSHIGSELKGKFSKNWEKNEQKPFRILTLFIWGYWGHVRSKKVSNGSVINFHYSGSHWRSVLGIFIKRSGLDRSLLCQCLMVDPVEGRTVRLLASRNSKGPSLSIGHYILKVVSTPGLLREERMI